MFKKILISAYKKVLNFLFFNFTVVYIQILCFYVCILVFSLMTMYKPGSPFPLALLSCIILYSLLFLIPSVGFVSRGAYHRVQKFFRWVEEKKVIRAFISLVLLYLFRFLGDTIKHFGVNLWGILLIVSIYLFLACFSKFFGQSDIVGVGKSMLGVLFGMKYFDSSAFLLYNIVLFLFLLFVSLKSGLEEKEDLEGEVSGGFVWHYNQAYEDIMCSKCHRGKDDGLMLLCGLCDSSAHTYCVGLGREVPEGHWYCEGCTPVALRSAISQTQTLLYQPTEEESRSYFDPYEDIMCSECHRGEDDGLMLFCVLCDSYAHTYCVGLGREVPEGHWSCEGCRLVALARRFPNGDVQGSFLSSIGATALSRKRSLSRHIQNITNGDGLINMGSRTGGTSTANLGSGFKTTQIGHGSETEPSQPAAVQDTGMLYPISEERVPYSNSLISARHSEIMSPNLGHLGNEEAVGHLSNNKFPGYQHIIDLELGYGQAQVDPLFGNQHLPTNMPPNIMSSTGGEQLQQRVKAHLKKLSTQIDLGQARFDKISTCSLHTILAACGLEHNSSEVHLVPPPVTCPHNAMRPGSSNNNILMKECCYSCFDSFVEDVVKMIFEQDNDRYRRVYKRRGKELENEGQEQKN